MAVNNLVKSIIVIQAKQNGTRTSQEHHRFNQKRNTDLFRNTIRECRKSLPRFLPIKWEILLGDFADSLVTKKIGSIPIIGTLSNFKIKSYDTTIRE